MDKYDHKAEEIRAMDDCHPDVAQAIAAFGRACAAEAIAAFLPLQIDNHYWSKRPCSTCQEVTKQIGQPYGCIKYAIDKATAERSAGKEG